MNGDRREMEELLQAYELGEELGRGAFGVVYRARHKALGRDVAIKQLPRALAAEPAVRDRFVREAQLVAALNHPHIVPVFDFMERDGLCLLVMEYLGGGSLASRRPLPTPEVWTIAEHVASALGHAHSRGVVHRDVKPDNVLFDAAGVVKLSDFGIAHVLDAESRLTATGTVVGTPAYMAPEQVTGGELGPPVDVYATGIMLYEGLAGRLPFPPVSTLSGQLMQHVQELPAPLTSVAPEIPARLADLVMMALAKDPAERPTDGTALAAALAAARTAPSGAAPTIVRTQVGAAPEAPPAEEPPSVQPPVADAIPAPPPAEPAPSDGIHRPRHRRVGVIAAAVLVLLVAAGVGLWIARDDGSTGDDPATAAAKVRDACGRRGVSTSACECVISGLRTRFQPADFAEVTETFESGRRPPARLRPLMQECNAA